MLLYLCELLTLGAKTFLQREDILSGLHFYKMLSEGWGFVSVFMLGIAIVILVSLLGSYFCSFVSNYWGYHLGITSTMLHT